MKNTNISVKKHQPYGLLLLMLLLCGSMSAKVNNYVGLFVNAGEWSLLPSQSNYSASFGANGGLGFQYELQAGRTYSSTRFLFDVGVGACGGFTAFLQASSASDVLPNQRDFNNRVFDYVYEVKDRHDNYTDVAVQVPLMIGVQHKRFYMLVGAKVYAHIWSMSTSTAVFNTYGRYSQYIGQTHMNDLRDMPMYQFFNNRVYTPKGVTSTLALDVDASLEIGGRLGVINYAVGYDVPKRTTELRLAAYVDYGLLDIHRNVKGALDPFIKATEYNNDLNSPDCAYNSETMVKNVVMNSIMSTANFAKAVNNLVVGLKFTVLFQLPEPGKCVLCTDAYRSTARTGGRRGGMKYEE